MAAIRYSGNATIRVWLNPRDTYGVSIAVAGRRVWYGEIGAPAVGFGAGIAYDSPEAFDQTARAGLSFALADAEEARHGGSSRAGEIEAETDMDGGWIVHRGRTLGEAAKLAAGGGRP